MTGRRHKTLQEETVQTHCAKLLEAYADPDICWFAVPNGGKRPRKTAKALKQQGVKTGVGDIFLVIKSHSHSLELKTEVGKQSKEQSDWQQLFERAGGIYHLAKGLDEALHVLKNIGAFRSGIKITSEAMTPR